MQHEHPTHVDLFSGIGGFALAAKWAGFKTVAFCEIESFGQAVLKTQFGAVMADPASQSANGYPKRKEPQHAMLRNSRPVIFSDIRQFDGSRFAGAGLLTGGFPCQPFSVAGKRKGSADDRFLWPEMLRVISEVQPAWVIGENVAGIVNMELDRCLSDLEGIGYECGALIIPACAVDAKHRRDRVWIMAHSGREYVQRRGEQCGGEEGTRARDRITRSIPYPVNVADSERAERRPNNEPGGHTSQGQDCQGEAASGPRKHGQTVADCIVSGLEVWEGQSRDDGAQLPAAVRDHRRLTQPGLGGMADGVSYWLDEPGDIPRTTTLQTPKSKRAGRGHRLKGLGNAIVPEVAYQILRHIREML